MRRAPTLANILRQHAEQAAFLWMVYDLQAPSDEGADIDAGNLALLAERLDAHLDGLRVAGEDGRRVADERFAEFREPGELFVLRMLQPGASGMRVAELDIEKVRAYLADQLHQPS